MAKRRKRAPKGKARSQRAKPEAMRLPGGRKLETVRVADPEGRPVTLVRTVDTLARMRKAGTITRAMHQAARDFQAHFTIAAYDTTATASIVRVRRLRGEKMTWNDDLTVRQIAARDRVHDALDAPAACRAPAAAASGMSWVCSHPCESGLCVRAGTEGLSDAVKPAESCSACSRSITATSGRGGLDDGGKEFCIWGVDSGRPQDVGCASIS